MLQCPRSEFRPAVDRRRACEKKFQRMEVINVSDYRCLLKHYIVKLSLILTILTITVIERSTASRIPSDFITHSRWIRATPNEGGKLFRCKDGNTIPKYLVCDGELNCPDGSDEKFSVCESVRCPKNTFRCAYGGCVDGDKECNGKQDCVDKSDESLLKCPNFKWLNDGVTKTCESSQFQCRDGECIPNYLLCDGRKDCKDGSDETVTHCNNQETRCLKNTFTCAYGGCVDQNAKCNGVIDCADGSDEDQDLCPQPSTSRPLEPVQPVTNLKPQQQTPKWECELPKQLEGVKVTRVIDNRIEITCEEFFYLYVNGRSDINLYTINCREGEWLDSKNYKCLPLCKPFKSPSARYNCTYNNEKVDCSKPMWPGTISKAECAFGYEEIESLYLVNKNECLENGKWNVSEPFTCKEVCGTISNAAAVEPQISNGVRANIPEYPWNVGIYQLGKDGKHEHLCGGSLITAFVVLTAAHCLMDNSNDQKENLKIAVGKYYREWDRENNMITQKRNISQIYVYEGYRAVYTNYEYDIGLAELEFAVTLNIAVRSVCLPISQQITNPEGVIVGWGLNQNNVAADKLQLAKLEYLSREKCLNKVQGTESLTEDKFCAKITSEQNATNIMKGDSGSGFVFESSKKYYIHGIVSTKIDGRIPTFTNITYNLMYGFVNKKLEQIRNGFALKYNTFH